MGKGCKIALIIGGIIFVLLIAAIIVGYLYCEKIGEAFLDKMVDSVEAKVLEDLPAGFDESEVKTEFRDFKEALKSGALKDHGKANELERLATDLRMAMSDEKIDADELQRLFEGMRRITGKGQVEE